MHKQTILALIAGTLTLMLLFSGCTDTPPETEQKVSPTVTVSEIPTPTPTPTPTPDFSHIDFTGIWNVTGIIKPDGNLLSESDFAQLDTDFYVEIIKDGVYFVYEGSGQILGQGKYSVSMNILTLSAGDMQTVYIIKDENTLHCMSADDSITVMTRSQNTDENDSEQTTDENDSEQATQEDEEDAP